jgi:hypothetical protein
LHVNGIGSPIDHCCKSRLEFLASFDRDRVDLQAEHLCGACCFSDEWLRERIGRIRQDCDAPKRRYNFLHQLQPLPAQIDACRGQPGNVSAGT